MLIATPLPRLLGIAARRRDSQVLSNFNGFRLGNGKGTTDESTTTRFLRWEITLVHRLPEVM